MKDKPKLTQDQSGTWQVEGDVGYVKGNVQYIDGSVRYVEGDVEWVGGNVRYAEGNVRYAEGYFKGNVEVHRWIWWASGLMLGFIGSGLLFVN